VRRGSWQFLMAVWHRFSASVSLSTMARKADDTVKAESTDYRAQASQKGLTPARLIEELKIIALSDIADYVEIDKDGTLAAKPLTDLKAKSRAVRKIKEKTTVTEKADGTVITRTSTLEYELHSKLDAIDAAMKIHGMKAPERREVSAEVKHAPDLPPEMQSVIDAIYAKES